MGKEQHSAELFERLTEGAAGPGPKFCEQMLARYIETLEQAAQRMRSDKAAAELQVRQLRNELWTQGVEAAKHRARAERAEADVKTLFALLVDIEAAR